jgi:hypothetical protein
MSSASASTIIEWDTEEYGSVSPLHFTVGYTDKDYSGFLTDDEIISAINHWAVGVYEMTNGRHRLGHIKVIKDANVKHEDFFKEAFNVSWHPVSPKPIVADIGTYIPYAQNGRNNGQISMNFHSVFNRNFASYTDGDSNILRYAGYSLAHGMAHYVYGVRRFTIPRHRVPAFQDFITEGFILLNA